MRGTNQVIDFVNHALKVNSISKIDVIKMMGYRNVNKGLRRLDRLYQLEEVDMDFVAKLSHVLNVAEGDIKKVLYEACEAKRKQPSIGCILAGC